MKLSSKIIAIACVAALLGELVQERDAFAARAGR